MKYSEIYTTVIASSSTYMLNWIYVAANISFIENAEFNGNIETVLYANTHFPLLQLGTQIVVLASFALS